MDPLLKTQEVSDLLKIGTRSVRQLIRTGKITAYLVTNCYRIPKSSVIQYLQSNKVR
jgi:excisionase family DNA binding protein